MTKEEIKKEILRRIDNVNKIRKEQHQPTQYTRGYLNGAEDALKHLFVIIEEKK